MSKSSIFNSFTNQYSLSKTLRFELRPQGKTLEFIEKNQLLNQDRLRADYYKKAKKIIDEYHKYFINEALDGLELNFLDEYLALYLVVKKDDLQKKNFEELETKLRKQIADRFSNHPSSSVKEKFKNLFAKELIKIDLKDFVQDENDKQIINEFDNFTTYFTGFHENRKNMYSSESKSTAIAYRLIHQNLPKFIDNMIVFEKIKQSKLAEMLPEVLKSLESIVQVNSLNDVFDINFFNETLTQNGITVYNTLLGGFTSDDGKVKIKGLNEYINLHNQTSSKEERIGKLKPLFKQILSDRNSVSFLQEDFKDDAEVLESIDAFYAELYNSLFTSSDLGISLIELIENPDNYNLSKIFIKNDLGLTDISQKMFGSWSVFQQAVNADFDYNYTGKSKKGTEKYELEQAKFFKKSDSFSVQYLNDCLLILDNKEYHKKVQHHLLSANDVIQDIMNRYADIEEILKTYPNDKNLAQDKSVVEKIKIFLDAIKSLQHFLKPFLGKGNEPEKDDKFYGEFERLYLILDQITPLYNKVRNYMTRKPYSTEKIKLNFENSTLLDGWDVNKEEANTSILFVKDSMYYLGIMDKNHNKLFRNLPKVRSTDFYQKVNYKLLPGASKMLPKVFFSDKNISYYAPSQEILQIRNTGAHTKNGSPQKGFEKADFDLNSCHKIIDFFKDSINKHPEWCKFGFKFSPTNSYITIDEFYREVEGQGYNISYTNIDSEIVNQWVNDGKLYLFKIYNKDFSPFSKGTPNMHTLYWKMLFNEDNLSNVVFKLNGQAEIFFRKSSIATENKIVHKANEAISNKNTLNKKQQSTFTYDIVKDKRFTVDKFQFHVPITLNFKANGNSNINSATNDAIRNNDIQHVIGIDRGERHLLYITVIDLEGNIKKQFSLNEIVNEYNGNLYKTNYHNLLDKKEGGRDEARKNWQTIETIKELKEGYLSQVIHKIAQLVTEYQAIVVLEDLNMGFMRGRQKVEKQVYQKFEKMLIDKFNFLADKRKDATELGGTLKALQLTNKFESFQKLGKQSGFLFYVPAWNTSKMDPATGFVNLLQIKYENVEKAKQFFNKFEKIVFNKNKNYFEFEIDYSKFTNKAEGTKTKWTICTYKDRIETFRNPEQNNQWDNREVLLTKEFVKLFNEFNIPFQEANLKQLIQEQTDKPFFERLMYLLKLTLQMRNSVTNTEVDYLISPVADNNGNFYDSREGKPTLPKDADANGAYNIARKGLWIIEQIKENTDDKKLKLGISNKQWLQFAQSN